MTKEFYLIRHAQSMGNIGLDTGYDPDLSPLGHAQAKQCASFMEDYCNEETLLLSSPFERCLITSEAIARSCDLEIIMVPALHEFFVAEWFPANRVKMMTLQQKKEKHPLITGNYPEGKWWPDKNESSEDMQIRLSMLRNRLLGNEFDSDSIICVGHWASVEALAVAMLPDINLPVVENAGITAIKYENGKFNLIFANEIP